MYIYGLTGGIGCGKSTVADMFAQYGDINIVGTDPLAKRIMRSSSVTAELAKIARLYEFEILDDGGLLNFDAFSPAFFADEKFRQLVEATVHPLVWQEVEEITSSNTSFIWIVESAILFESHSEDRFDKIICVTCDCDKQFSRLIGRGYEKDEAMARIRSQMPTSKKAELSDFVVTTDVSVRDTRRQVHTIHAELIR